MPGVRRFSLDPATSRFEVVPGASISGFQGYLDLMIGPLDGAGVAKVHIVGSSPFLSLPLGGPTLCLRPLVPVMDAGVIDCDGGSNLGVKTTQDHNLGLAEPACTAAGGSIDELATHAGVCNGPIVTAPSDVPDSGLGALLIAPDPQRATNGLPVEFAIVQAGSCAPGEPVEVFAFTTASYRAEITDAGNMAGMVLMHTEQGENFSCAMFTEENGPGRLVFTLGTLHGAGASDFVLVFVLDD